MFVADIERIIELTGEILRKSARGSYVYRGEPECYPLVSSGLYRACAESEDEMFDLDLVEQDVVTQATDYVASGSRDDILAEIQHFGGTTNLIDFTDDYLIALFFASAASPEKDGRVVLHWSYLANVVRPKRTSSRAVFQKSVMVRTSRGFLVPDDKETVIVPADLKEDILEFLEQCHGISERRVYDDIHGYIRNQNTNRTAYAAEFNARRARPRESPDLGRILAAGIDNVHRVTMRNYLYQKGMDYVDGPESLFSWDSTTEDESASSHDLMLLPGEVVEFLTACLEDGGRGVESAKVYCWRGDAHLFQGSVELAETDFKRALEFNSGLADAYHGLANVRKQQGDDGAAVADLERALALNPQHRAALIDRGNASREGGQLEAAVRDFGAVVSDTREASRHTWYRDGHFFRAVARCIQENWFDAEEDFVRARRGGLRTALSFRNVFGGVERFEENYSLKLPSVIKTQLYVP